MPARSVKRARLLPVADRQFLRHGHLTGTTPSLRWAPVRPRRSCGGSELYAGGWRGGLAGGEGLSAATVSLTAPEITVPGALAGTTSVTLAATGGGISETGAVTTRAADGQFRRYGRPVRHQRHRCGGSECGGAVQCGWPELYAGGWRRGLACGEWAECGDGKPDRAGGQHPWRSDRHNQCRPGGHRRRDQRERRGDDSAADRRRTLARST